MNSKLSIAIFASFVLALTVGCGEDKTVSKQLPRGGSFGPIAAVPFGANVQKALQEEGINLDSNYSCARRIEYKTGNQLSVVVAIVVGDSCGNINEPAVGDVVAVFQTTQNGSVAILHSEEYGAQYPMGQLTTVGDNSYELTDLCTGNYGACYIHGDSSGYISEIELY